MRTVCFSQQSCCSKKSIQLCTVVVSFLISSSHSLVHAAMRDCAVRLYAAWQYLEHGKVAQIMFAVEVIREQVLKDMVWQCCDACHTTTKIKSGEQHGHAHAHAHTHAHTHTHTRTRT